MSMDTRLCTLLASGMHAGEYIWYVYYELSCRSGYKELALYLLSLGADVLLKNRVGETALHIAAAHGQHEACRVISERPGVDLFARDAEGHTPIDQALTSGFKELAGKIALWSVVDLRTQVTIVCCHCLKNTV